jgi:transposase
VAHVSDLSRSVVTFEQSTTLVAVVEMSAKSWLVAGTVPGIERQPVKKLEPDAPGILRLIERWRSKAIKAGWTISRVVRPVPCRAIVGDLAERTYPLKPRAS